MSKYCLTVNCQSARGVVAALSWLCCANAVRDSLCESSLLVRLHQQTEAADLPHHELA